MISLAETQSAHNHSNWEIDLQCSQFEIEMMSGWSRAVSASKTEQKDALTKGGRHFELTIFI